MGSEILFSQAYVVVDGGQKREEKEERGEYFVGAERNTKAMEKCSRRNCHT